MKEVIVNIFILLYYPNPDSPYGLDRTEEFRENRQVYEEKVKHFTNKYDNPMKANKKYSKNEDWDFSL